jgi:hypothetical protein
MSPPSATLAGLDELSVTNLRRLNRAQVLEQLGTLGLARITLDFDGSVLSTGRFAEGTTVGFNRKKKGQRSYHPFIPYEYAHDFKVIVINKQVFAKKSVEFS